MDKQQAVRPDWKTALIPSDAPNATEPTIASAAEVEAIIANPESLRVPEPLPEIEAAPRYNPGSSYSPQTFVYTPQDYKLMDKIKVAVANGWRGAHHYANDSVTIGMEGEAIVRAIHKGTTSAVDLLADDDFIKALSR